jgi:hypothetical protein
MGGNKTDDDRGDRSKYITSFGTPSSSPGKRSGADGKEPEEGNSSRFKTPEKGKFAFLGGIGFGIIAIIFLFFMERSLEVVGLAFVGMILLGTKAFLLVYPRVAVVSTTSLNVKSYFFTAIFLMAWIAFMWWAFSYMADSPDLGSDYNIEWIKIVILSILTAISMFFLTMTMTRR